MPYLFTDIGASVSKYTGFIWNAGVGADINVKGSHTIFISLGGGINTRPRVPDAWGIGYDEDQQLQTSGTFALNFKIGYYF